MRRHLVLVMVLLAVNAAAAAAERVRLDYSRAAESITKVVVEAAVGDVEIIGDGGATISARVDVTDKVSKFWRSSHEDLDNLAIEAEVRNGELHLRVGGDRDDEHSWGEDWTVHLPTAMSVALELGVGDTRVLDVAGDIDVEVGVGEVSVEGEYASFGSIRASSGVGDASLRTPQSREDGGGFISHSLRSRGPGKSTVQISAGVGDTRIKLR